MKYSNLIFSIIFKKKISEIGRHTSYKPLNWMWIKALNFYRQDLLDDILEKQLSEKGLGGVEEVQKTENFFKHLIF